MIDDNSAVKLYVTFRISIEVNLTSYETVSRLCSLTVDLQCIFSHYDLVNESIVTKLILYSIELYSIRSGHLDFTCFNCFNHLLVISMLLYLFVDCSPSFEVYPQFN